jgi:hypothetical protein
MRDGATLTADRGPWTGTPTITYAYRSRRCDNVAHANGSYRARTADVGGTIRVS